ncbi:MAG: Isochorismate synthase, partial [Bacteroidota bacterium]
MIEEKKWEDGISKGAAQVAWRLPHASEAFLLQDFQGGSQLSEGWNLSELSTGFLAAPFIGLPYFLQADSLHTFSIRSSAKVTSSISAQENSAKKQEFMGWVSKAVSAIKQG